MYRHRSKMGLHRRHLRADFLFELSLFGRRHRFEEKLHLLHSRLGRFWCDCAWTISGVVSFLLTPVACPSYVSLVLPSQGVGRFRGTRSAGRHLTFPWVSRQRSAKPV